jgi:hypothetical protein
MPAWTLTEIETAMRSSWGPDTLFASEEYMVGSGGQPSRGPCGTTAVVVQCLHGGDLMMTDVEYDGQVDGALLESQAGAWWVRPDKRSFRSE